MAKGLLDSRGQNLGWAFRAEQFGANLKTTLERAIEGSEQNLSSASKIEFRVTRHFKRRAHHYIPDLPEETDTLQWLAWMQHYGAPTRLMDWTYSAFVALFFAVARKAPNNSGAVIWAINMEWVRRTANSILSASGMTVIPDDDLMRQFYENDIGRFKDLFHPDKPTSERLEPLLYPMNPLRLNERLTIQQGVFLCPRRLSIGFVDNLLALKPTGDNLKAFVVSPSSRSHILADLDRMNMNNATLFPGLQGFAESLWTNPMCYHPSYSTFDDIR